MGDPEVVAVGELVVERATEVRHHDVGESIPALVPVDVEVTAKRLSGPWRSTSHHHGLAGLTSPMWFGTMSSTRPRPAARAAATQLGEARVAAELGRQRGRVDDVVAVGAPRRGLERRRQVEVADAELGEVAARPAASSNVKPAWSCSR